MCDFEFHILTCNFENIKLRAFAFQTYRAKRKPIVNPQMPHSAGFAFNASSFKKQLKRDYVVLVPVNFSKSFQHGYI